MNENNNLRKLEVFFEDDLKVKKILNDIIPEEIDFYNDEAKFNYTDKVIDNLSRIELYINRMLLNYNISNKILIEFDTKIKELQNYIKSESFYQLLKQGYPKVLKFIHTNISNMRPNFVESVRKQFIGYTLFTSPTEVPPTTINEFLHYIHSYVINNEKFYSAVPIVRTTKENNYDWMGISLRGISTDFGNKLYEKILNSNIDSDCIDIINLDKTILIMARDLGHATVIEMELDKEKIFVKYFIPKNNNLEMVSLLKGININKQEFATGSFETTKENATEDLCSLMKGIPTDADINLSKFGLN